MSEIDNIYSILCCNFCDDWDYKKNENTITLTRDIGDHKETIRVTKHNQWFITIKIMDRQLQLFTPTSYNAHHEKHLSPEHVSIINALFNKLMNHYTLYKSHKVGKLIYGTFVEKESCNIGKQHNHFYVTQYTSIVMDDSCNILPYLSMRYNFFHL